MIEPTETEGKAEMDLFIDAMISIAKEVEEDPQMVLDAPHTTRVSRLDETGSRAEACSSLETSRLLTTENTECHRGLRLSRLSDARSGNPLCCSVSSVVNALYLLLLGNLDRRPRVLPIHVHVATGAHLVE